MSFYILGIAASPRQNSNSAWLLQESMLALKERGHRTETIRLAKLKFSPCQGCGACSTTGECVIRDDMQELQQKILAADRVIVAAPIFFMGLNSQAKAMIDRMQPFWAKKYLLHVPVLAESGRERRRGLFISTAGTKFKDVFTCAQRSVQVLFNMTEIEYAGECLFPGVDEAGEIVRVPGAGEKVRAATLDILG